MKTIEIYENKETKELETLLKKLEKNLLNIEKNIIYNINNFISEYDFNELKKEKDDHEIDISLIRMELTKRFWFNSIEK